MGLVIAISVILGAYIIMLLVFAVAFSKEKAVETSSAINPDVSVIVAFRNEEKNLNALINSILAQNYAGKFEIILVNDHSDDNSVKIINEFSEDRVKVIDLPVGLEGKKSALRYAHDFAKGEVLIFTDADCVVPETWINTLQNRLNSSDEKMLCAPVVFNDGMGFWQKIFALEFMSLTGSGAAGFFIDQPFMCNGANYAIYKSVLTEAFANINDKFSSGDDVFLLHYVSSHYKAGFIKSGKATVVTKSPDNLAEFFAQRIRWASKTTGYRKAFAVFTALVTFWASVSVLVLGIASIFINDYLVFFVIGYGLKLVAELVFMIPVTRFYQKQNLLWLMPILVFLHPFYVITTAVLSLIYKPKWKGRRIR
ncbi:MAG: glycosyltransferase [Bacteroidales bacterium]|nr:glycosyltransferase [Bacteroidales bacterium]